MRAAILLALAVAAAADDAGIDRARGIAKAGPEAARAAIPALIELGKGTPAERFAARDALVVAGPPAVARLIGEAGGNPSLRLLLEGVSFDLGARVVVVALPALADGSAKTRAMAAVALGAAGPGGEAAVKQLVELLHDADTGVRREAARALGGIGRGAHDAIPGLIHLANDPERGHQHEALLALGRIVRDAAERDRPAPEVPADAARAIKAGTAWLERQQRPDGWWEFGSGDPSDLAQERARLTALVLLAMLETGDGPPPTGVRVGLRCLASADGVEGPFHVPAGSVEGVFPALCAGARVTGEPECRAAAERALKARALRHGAGPSGYGWRALGIAEAGFAGLFGQGSLKVEGAELPLGEEALVQLVAGGDPKADTALHTALEMGVQQKAKNPESTFFAARARWYAGRKSDELIATLCASQREDGSWDLPENRRGPCHSTACMLLSLEAAAGIARPLAMPLPNAPQLKAAVATLRIAAQSKDEPLRAAAQQALAGFR